MNDRRTSPMPLSTNPPRRTSKKAKSQKSWLLMLAVAPALLASSAFAANYTWDPLLTTTGSDGPGAWDTTSNIWATAGADTAWLNDGSATAIFGSGGTAGTVTLNAPINAAGLTFNTTSGDYTLAASTGNTLTLSGTAPTITVIAGQSPTISAPIAGTGGLILNDGINTGNLTLTGANTYTGTTTINSGTLIVNAGGTLGAVTNALVVGQPSVTDPLTSPTTSPGNLILNTSATVGSLTTATNSTTFGTININGSSVLTVNGGLTVGLTSAATTAPTVGLAILGNELDLNGSLTVGLAEAGARYVSTLNLSGLTTFVMNAPTGAFNGGVATDANSTISLAQNNVITASSLTLSSATGNAGSAILTLGAGTNVFNVNTMILGFGKGNAEVHFASPNVGSITINGTAGPGSVTNITLSDFTSATPNNSQSNLSLASHDANVNAGTVIIGELANATGRTANGTITFDTGTFNAQALEIALDVNGSKSGSTFGAIGSFVLGTDASSTGVLNVSNTFWLGSVTSTSANATFSNATFTINGGTANINTNILLNIGAGATGVSNSTLTLHAGTLNMSGFAIGTAAAPITTVNLVPNSGDSAVLANLGGTGINGNGLTVNGAGTLILAGTNTYSGTTIINAGSTLQIGSPTLDASLPSGGSVDVEGSLVFARGNSATLNAIITGGGTVSQNGTGSTALTGANSYLGATTINAGTLFINGSLSNSTVALNAGTLGGSGSIATDITLSPGTTLLGGGSDTDTTGTLSLGNLTVNGGTLTFNLGSTSASQITAANATFNATPAISFNLVSSPVSGSVFTLFTAGTLTDNGLLASLNTTSIGRLTLTPTESGNSIIVTVSGQTANLVFNGAADGTTWDVQTTANFLNTGTSAQDVFYTQDAVTFNDANNGHYNVTLAGSLQPSALTVNNSTGNYIFAGTGSIDGATGLTKSGTGSLTLANSGGNTYTGTTAIQNGKLILGSSAALPAAASVTFGDASNDSGTLDLGGNNASVSSLAVIGGSANTITNSGSALGTLTFQTGASTFSGAIQDGASPVALNLASGKLTLTGANTYTGGTTVSGGALILGGSLGAGPITVNAGSFTLNTGASIAPTTALTDGGTVNLANPATTLATLAGAGTLNLNGTALSLTSSSSFAGIIADGSAPGSVTLSNGTFTLSGANTYTGDTSLQNATLRAASSTAAGAITGGNVNIPAGSTFDVGAGAAANSLNFGARVFNIAGTGTNGQGALTNSATPSQFGSYDFITLTADATIGGARSDIGRNGSGDVLDLAGHTLTIDIASGTGIQPIFGIEGNGTVPTNVTAGQIIINTGGLDIETVANILADTSGSTITYNTGTVAQFYKTVGTNITRPLIFMGNNLIGSGDAGATNGAIVNSPITLNGNVTFEPLASGNATLTAVNLLTLNGTITDTTGTASVTSLGVGTTTLAGAGNTWGGGTFITGGTLQAGIDNPLPVNGNVTIGGGATSGTLDLNGYNVSVGGLATAGTGTANLIGNGGAAPATLTFAGNAAPSTFAGTIQDVVGAGSSTTALVVSGGSLNLSAPNTFSGGTTLSGGKLLVSNTSGSALGSGNVTLNAGTFGGAGAITGSLIPGAGPHTIHPGPGSGATGTLAIGGDLATNANTTLAFDLTSPTATNSLLAVAGNVTLNGGTLAITSQATTGVASLGYYKVLSYAGSLTGTASGIVLPAIANNLEYTLTTNQDLGFIDIHLGYLGDANDDGTVDATDLNTVLNHLGVATSSWNLGNFDGAATIDLNDLNDALNNLGTSIPSSPTEIVSSGPVTTPEPATLTVGGLAALALLIRRKRNLK